MKLSDIVVQGVHEKSFPQILYKYRAFNEFTDKIFINQELWFSNPYEFNDPFEFKIYDKGNYKNKDVLSYLKKMGMNKTQAKEYLSSINQNKISMVSLIEKAKEQIFSRCGVFSMTKSPDNILMWSHYAKNHTGFILGFDLLSDPDFFSIPLNVEYSKEYPSVPFLTKQDQIINSCVKTKYIDWSYEEEVRIYKPMTGLHTFKRDALRKVILGCKCPESNIKKIQGLVNGNGYKNVSFCKAEISKTRYKIHINPI